MFPTIGDLVYYLFHFRVSFPVQTFGFFVALSFFFAYIIFTSEFKRYEANGKIRAFNCEVVMGMPASFLELLVNFLLGFFFGLKFFGLIFHYNSFVANPRGYILSTQGSIFAGLVIGILFGYWIYFEKRKNQLSKPVITTQKVHPYQLMPLIVFSVGFFGFIGAKLFDSVEHFDMLMAKPWQTLFSSNGFAYYGGLIFGALTYLYIGYKRGMKLVHLADIGSPGMMLAYGIGRIGCQLAGDGDWGIVNKHVKPAFLNWLPDWAWSFRYPHNSINAGTLIPECNGNYCNQLVNGVYPTPLYEAVLCIGMFLLLWAFRKKIKTPGLMFSLYLILNGGERFLVEHIRINFNYPIFGFTFTQAEIIGFLMLLGGITGLIILTVNKYRSSNIISK
ncbi:prolipoprotein diacylglyceryl transferase [Mucilaginibacter segetis]|uniref:Prolipoprotein diacylglyceryl transferase n=1 Tax=Mucilaginibacter segetis TaxID=2793071 RepID=A0A934UNI3_9SPHI|nr:prolipoprotein diacylglyceryl transferase family protein [Mucilaginibacter segetis]MBK0380828.1 prolipoprotein diacylglyceryl transferase [Mucilaginibacter segetis]